MNGFGRKLYEVMPAVHKYRTVCRNGHIKVQALLEGAWNSKCLQVPYLEAVTGFLEEHKSGVPGRILFITEQEHVAVTSAAYINSYLFGDEEEWYEDWYEEEEEEGELPGQKLHVINLQQGNSTEKNGINKYVLCLTEAEDKEMVLFTGLSSNEEIQEKLEAVMACPSMLTGIWISPDRLQEAWVQELLIEYGFYPLRLGELKQEYYEQVLDFLLRQESWQLDKDIAPKLLIRKISKRRDKRFCEADIAWYLDKALEHACKRNPDSRVFLPEDFKDLSLGEKKPMERLQEMTGVQAVKDIARETAALVRESLHNHKLGILHKSMLFLGNPGTGKTTCAGLLADIMAEEGENNAAFVTAGRKDLIGEYVGHTAPKVAQKFEEARGGVLFIDEAGFFLNTEAGGFVTEAMKELVRYMEMYPDVTVIFAMYPEEAKRFLELDEGLASRISRFVSFEDYSNRELGSIAVQMWKEKGYKVDKEAVSLVECYMEQLRRSRKKSFGNAREVRRLTEAAIIAASLRHYQSKKNSNRITAGDVEEGWERLCRDGITQQKCFGFGVGQVQ